MPPETSTSTSRPCARAAATSTCAGVMLSSSTISAPAASASSSSPRFVTSTSMRSGCGAFAFAASTAARTEPHAAMWLSLIRMPRAEIEAVVAAAAGEHRRLLEHAKPGRGLAGVDDRAPSCRRPRRRSASRASRRRDSRCTKLSAVRSAASTPCAGPRDRQRAAAPRSTRAPSGAVRSRSRSPASTIANTAAAMSMPNATIGSRAIMSATTSGRRGRRVDRATSHRRGRDPRRARARSAGEQPESRRAPRRTGVVMPAQHTQPTSRVESQLVRRSGATTFAGQPAA